MINSFFPSPYKIINPEIRHKYKIFLKVIHTLGIEEDFISWYKTLRPTRLQPDHICKYFSKKEHCRDGYVNSLGSWCLLNLRTQRVLPNNIEAILRFMWILTDWSFGRMSLTYPRHPNTCEINGEVMSKLTGFTCFYNDVNYDNACDFLLGKFAQNNKLVDIMKDGGVTGIMRFLHFRKQQLL